MAHEITPDQDNPFLVLGRIIEENFYKRENKFYDLGEIKIDLIKKEKENLLICEVKKSSRYLKSIIMQVAFYLLKLKENGVIAKGEILVPKERKRIELELIEEIENELLKSIPEIEKIILLENPPQKEKIRFCTHCAFREFCWS